MVVYPTVYHEVDLFQTSAFIFQRTIQHTRIKRKENCVYDLVQENNEILSLEKLLAFNRE